MFQQIEEVLRKKNIPHTNLNLNVHPNSLRELTDKELNYLKHREKTKLITPSVSYVFPKNLHVIISNHALERWNERIGPMIEHKTLIYTFLRLHKQGRIQYYKGETLLGVIDNEIVFVYEKNSLNEIAILTFIGRISVKPKLRNLNNFKKFSLREDTLDLTLEVDSQIFLEQILPILPFAYSYENVGGSNLYIECYGKEKPFIFLRSKNANQLIDVTQYLWDCKKEMIIKFREMKRRITDQLLQEKEEYKKWIYHHHILKDSSHSKQIGSFEKKWTTYKEEYELTQLPSVTEVREKCMQEGIQKINDTFKKLINNLMRCPLKQMENAKKQAERHFKKYPEFIENYTLDKINQIYQERLRNKYIFTALSEAEQELLHEKRTVDDFKKSLIAKRELREFQKQRLKKMQPKNKSTFINPVLPNQTNTKEQPTKVEKKDLDVADWLLDMY